MFKITRADGRSHQQVLIDAVHKEPPGTLFTFEDLMNILGFSRIDRTRNVVISSQNLLLKNHSRTMENIRGIGYKIAEASEHNRIANKHTNKAHRQIKKGLHVLKNVRWDEMDEETRKAHQGTLMITEGLYNMQLAYNKRLTRVEDAIRNAGFIE